jgi:hypothetical protein
MKLRACPLVSSHECLLEDPDASKMGSRHADSGLLDASQLVRPRELLTHARNSCDRGGARTFLAEPLPRRPIEHPIVATAYAFGAVVMSADEAIGDKTKNVEGCEPGSAPARPVHDRLLQNIRPEFRARPGLRPPIIAHQLPGNRQPGHSVAASDDRPSMDPGLRGGSFPDASSASSFMRLHALARAARRVRSRQLERARRAEPTTSQQEAGRDC